MSNHHGHHHRSHHRSRSRHSHHPRSMRGSTSSIQNGSSSRGTQLRDSNGPSDWSEHRSSSGKLYYYNTRTGVSQWDLPAELRPQRAISPESENSESSSIRLQQENSPTSSTSNHSTQSDATFEDKPLITPNLVQYYKPELVSEFTSGHLDELERQSTDYSRKNQNLSERILEVSTELKIAKAQVCFIETKQAALEERYSKTQEAIKKSGFPL